jgi:hypothetical protein
MKPLTHYSEFLERANQLGFMPFSHFLPGFPSVSAETLPNIWYTGDAETDPWRWKDRAAEEKRLAYGCILGGHKGFVTERMYPIFLAAYRPEYSFQELYETGSLDQMTWRVWKLFDEHRILETHRVRRLMGVNKSTGSRVDAILRRLQQEYAITVSGSAQKVSAKGQLYGWRSNVYSLVEDWAPASWLQEAGEWTAEEARDLILDDALAMSQGISRAALAGKLGLPLERTRIPRINE